MNKTYQGTGKHAHAYYLYFYVTIISKCASKRSSSGFQNLAQSLKQILFAHSGTQQDFKDRHERTGQHRKMLLFHPSYFIAGQSDSKVGQRMLKRKESLSQDSCQYPQFLLCYHSFWLSCRPYAGLRCFPVP
jgi:hypothetical protein